MQFYTVSYDLNDKKGLPWISSLSRKGNKRNCKVCGKRLLDFDAEMIAILDSAEVDLWPDVIGNGSMPVLVISRKLFSDWKTLNIHFDGFHRLKFMKTNQGLPKKHEYFWINPKCIRGVKIDFEKSGYIGVKKCLNCKQYSFDISKTFDNLMFQKHPISFIHDSWNGSDLFTSDFFPFIYFCTQRLVNCSKERFHTNVEFTPIENANLL